MYRSVPASKELSDRRVWQTAAVCTLCLVLFGTGCATGAQSETPGAAETAATKQATTEEKADPKERLRSLHPSRADIDKLSEDLHARLMASALIADWKKRAESSEPPLIMVVPMRAETDRRWVAGLTTVLDRIETRLVNDPIATVLSLDAYDKRLIDIPRNQGNEQEAIDISKLGRELGLDYVLTGTIATDVLPTPDTESVTYSLSLRVIDVSKQSVVFETALDLEKTALAESP